MSIAVITLCCSPDGKQVAFTSNRDGTYNLYVMNADGASLRESTHEEDPNVAYMPSWSDDCIAFGFHGKQPWMAIISPNSKDFRIIGKGHDPCISPDGDVVAVKRALAGKADLPQVDEYDSDEVKFVLRICYELQQGWETSHFSWLPGRQRA